MGFDVVQSVLILYAEDKSTIYILSVCTLPPGYSLSTSNTTVLMYLSPWDRAIEKLIFAHLINDFGAFFSGGWGSTQKFVTVSTLLSHIEPVESIPRLSTTRYLTRSLVV